MNNTDVMIAELWLEAERRGYRFVETRDGARITVQMYRPDGSLAMIAVHHEDTATIQPREVQ